jgi:hypothetical protein
MTESVVTRSHDIDEILFLDKVLKGKNGKLINQRLNNQIGIKESEKFWCYFWISLD